MNDNLSETDWEQAASSLTIEGRAFINGCYVDAASGNTFKDISPVDGRQLLEVASTDTEDADLAVAAARRAFDEGPWRRSADLRKQTLYALADLIEKNIQELALLETLDMGKPIAMSLSGDILQAAKTLRFYAETVDKVGGELPATPGNDLTLVSREPVGVVAAIVPWNFPLMLAMWKIAPALAAGNSVILKPAEQSPLTAIRMAALAKEAGVPDGVVGVLPGFGENIGKALALHQGVDVLAFTGSTATGKMLMQYSGQSNLKQVFLECGGKSPNIIFSDCRDLDHAIEQAASGIFFNCGQVCVATSRLLVERTVYSEVMERLVAMADGLQPANPLGFKCALGPVVNAEHKAKVENYIALGNKEGAQMLAGPPINELGSPDCYVKPTIFGEVDNSMTIAREEIFGPVLSVMHFDSQEQAVSLANDTRYGLFASVWSDNLDRVFAVSRALQSGYVGVNNIRTGGIHAPFGGVKESGFGRDLSMHALDKYTHLKTTFVKLS